MLAAAIRAGLRHLSASEVIHEDRRWLSIFGLPAAPTYKGARFDPKCGFKKKSQSEPAAA